MSWKKILIGFFSVVLVVVLAGCSNKGQQASDTSEKTNTTYSDLSTKQKIALVARNEFSTSAATNKTLYYHQDDDDFILANNDKTKVAQFSIEKDEVEFDGDSDVDANKTFSLNELIKQYYNTDAKKKTINNIAKSLKYDTYLNDDDQDSEMSTSNSTADNDDSTGTTSGDISTKDQAESYLKSQCGDADWDDIGHLSDNTKWTFVAETNSPDGSIKKGQRVTVHADHNIQFLNK